MTNDAQAWSTFKSYIDNSTSKNVKWLCILQVEFQQEWAYNDNIRARLKKQWNYTVTRNFYDIHIYNLL